MRLLFVGQAPSRETDLKPPFTGKCGRFLAELLGTTQEQMLLDHDFINVLDRWPGKGIGGDKFPMREARVAADQKLLLLRDRHAVLLGANVARAFGIASFCYGNWYNICRKLDDRIVVVATVTIVPHPSGVNRYYNDPTKRLIVAKFLRTIAAKDPGKS
jgi:uracil-DNA glycosylase